MFFSFDFWQVGALFVCLNSFLTIIYLNIVKNDVLKSKQIMLGNTALIFIMTLFFYFFLSNISSGEFSIIEFCFCSCYIYIGFDFLSLIMLALNSLLFYIVVLGSWISIPSKKMALHLILLGMMQGVLNNLFCTLDIIHFYILFESIAIPMFIHIYIFGSRTAKIRAGYLFFYYTIAGSLLMLLAIIKIVIVTGTTYYPNILNGFGLIPNEMKFWLWLCFFLGFMSKVPMPPFHIWLPKAHVEAHTSGSIILAGILLKLAIFGFYRFCLINFAEVVEVFIPFIYLLCLSGILFASFSALRQTDIKRIIAYSSIAHMNLVVMGLFTNNELGIIGSLLQSISHGFVSGALFFLIGVLYDRFHTRLLVYYKGIILFMPIFSLFFIFFNFANVAFPGTSSFVGEFLILTSLFQYYTGTVLFAGLGIILGVCYTLWLVNRVCFTNLSYFKLYYGFKNADLN